MLHLLHQAMRVVQIPDDAHRQMVEQKDGMPLEVWSRWCACATGYAYEGTCTFISLSWNGSPSINPFQPIKKADSSAESRQIGFLLYL